MKKLTAIISILTSVCMAGSTLCGYYVSAETTSSRPEHTYLELVEMSDEEIINEYDGFIDYYVAAGFGNDELSEDEKFENFWPDITIGNASYEDDNYMWRRLFLNGEETPYLELHVNDDVNIDFSLTAADFGFPEEWEIRFNRGYVCFDESFYDYRYYYGHEYKINVPVEIFEDFESYIRLELAGSSADEIFSDYAIYSFSSPSDAMAPDGRMPMAVFPGDINDSDSVDMSDAVALMANVSTPEEYPLTDLQLLLSDVCQQGDGVGINDAVSIQKYLTKQIDSLPESTL